MDAKRCHRYCYELKVDSSASQRGSTVSADAMLGTLPPCTSLVAARLPAESRAEHSVVTVWMMALRYKLDIDAAVSSLRLIMDAFRARELSWRASGGREGVHVDRWVGTTN